MSAIKHKNIFVSGAISASFIAEKIQAHQDKLNIGGHSIFLGQVRADDIENKIVTAIDYTSYEELALEQMSQVREETFSKYDLTCMHIYHSLGKVKAGEICLFVFTSSPLGTFLCCIAAIVALSETVTVAVAMALRSVSYLWVMLTMSVVFLPLIGVVFK